MDRRLVASTADGKVEIFGVGSAGRTRWAFAHWLDRAGETGELGAMVDGPLETREAAVAAARQRFGELDFREVPPGVDALAWADVPDQVRQLVESVLAD